MIVLPAASTAAGFNDSGASGTFNLADWTGDRYEPSGWAPGSTDPLSGTALKITLSNADRDNLRPPSYNNNTFYSTQGKVRLSPGVNEVSGKLFIPADWGTPGNLRRSDIWSRDNNPVENNSRYLICGFINNNPTDGFNPAPVGFVPRFRAWDSTVGWTNLTAPVLYGQYNTIRMVDTGTRHEYYINGALVKVNSGSSYSQVGFNGLRQVILNSFNFGIAANSVSLPDSGYDVYWKDVAALVTPTGGLPVDLNGSYSAPGATSATNALASATTFASANQVTEQASGAAAIENSFTPFSDLDKKPTGLSGLNVRGKSYSANLDAGDLSLWNAGREVFQLGLGKTAGYVSGTEESFVGVRKSGSAIEIYHATDRNAPVATSWISGAGTTQVRVQVDIDAAGANASLTVTPLNGAGVGVPVVVGSYSLDGVDNTLTASFFAGFTSSAAGANSARMAVSEFRTNATTNSLFAFAADPYNMPSEAADFALGQANLNTPFGGFQAYLASTGTILAGMSSYTNAPYSQHPVTPSPWPSAYGYITPQTGFLTVQDATLGNATFSGLHGASGTVEINPNNGLGLDTQFNDGDGNAFIADRRGSNITMFDGVAPSVSLPTATQGTLSVFSNPVMTGMLNIGLTASDAFTGLLQHPSVKIDFAPLGAGPEDVTLPVSSTSGNAFAASYNVPNNAPSGAGALLVSAVDRAGNVQANSYPLNVNTATLTVNLQLQGVSAASITRGVEITLGGNPASGINAPISLNRNVTFLAGSATVVFNALDGIPTTSGVLNYAVGAKDTLHTLRSTVAAPGVGNQYVANVNGPKALRGGNLNTDNKIDIGDYVVYATRFGIPVSPNTPFAVPFGPHAPTLRHADISGDGNVDSVEFSYISAGFATQFDDTAPGTFGREDRTIRTRITVVQAMIESGSRRAADMDLNRDGVITMDEVQQYLSRLR